jgi:hypothetical protein
MPEQRSSIQSISEVGRQERLERSFLRRRASRIRTGPTTMITGRGTNASGASQNQWVKANLWRGYVERNLVPDGKYYNLVYVSLPASCLDPWL